MMAPSLWLVETSSTSLKPLNEMQSKLTGSTSPTMFLFFELICKQKLLPLAIRQNVGTLYLGTHYVALWASCLNMPTSYLRGNDPRWRCSKLFHVLSQFHKRPREKRKRSDSVLWQKPLHQQKCQKGKVTTQTTPQKVWLQSGCGST